MLLVWADGSENFYAQCANVGDSACVVKCVITLPSVISFLTVKYMAAFQYGSWLLLKFFILVNDLICFAWSVTNLLV